MDRLYGFGVLAGRDAVLSCFGSLSLRWKIIRRIVVRTAVGLS